MKSIPLILAAFLVLTGCNALDMSPLGISPAERGYQAILDENWPRAESELRVAVERNANDAHSILNLGWVLHQTGRHGEARGYYEQVLQMTNGTADRASERGSAGKSLHLMARENIAMLPG